MRRKSSFRGELDESCNHECDQDDCVVGDTLWGIFLVLVSSVAIAFYYVWIVELTRAHGTLTVAAWSRGFGFIALLPWAGWELAQSTADFNATGLSAAAFLGWAVTVAGLYMWLGLLRRVPARVAASVQYLQPIFGIGVAAMFLGDRLGLAFVMGSALVLVGLGMTLSRR